MHQLKPLEIPLAGKNLIQASAGTGKTWTISLLYIRLVIEQRLTVDQLLVVTYTRAATEELRDRIRERLKVAVASYEEPETAQQEYQQLLALYPPDEERLWCLRRALLSFDEAAVFTIHGFCQRALQENAFDVGLPFDSDLIQDEHELQIALTDQFWQQRLLQPNGPDRSLLESGALTPDRLLFDVRDFIGKPYLVPVGVEPVSAEHYSQLKEQYDQLLQTVRQLWQQEAQEILALLSPQIMNQQAYKPAQLESAATALQTLFDGQVPGDAQKLLGKFTPQSIAAKTKKGQITPEHQFFEKMSLLLEALEALQVMCANALEQLRFDLLLWLREQLPQRKRQSGLLAFDDLLINLQLALESRPELASALANQYHVALIDEFQDTDPVQFEVFRQIYQGNPGSLFYVGDPKQAIYSFRGADINTYLYAAESVTEEQRYTLDKNFRSLPELINAFNHLFSYASDPFANQRRIDYERVSAGGVVKDQLVSDSRMPPLRLWDWDNDDGTTSRQQVLEQIARATANDIAGLLRQGQRGEALIGDKPVSSGDFAVLVRSHKQGRLIKQALQRCGIASVQKSPLGIFETHEATELRALLQAIAEPGNMLKVRRALVTELMGGSAQNLLDMDHYPQQLESALEDFYRWNQLWQSKGFMPMLRDWMASCGIYQRLLAYIDGERRMTNLLHLAELIHAETRERWGGMQQLIRWLQAQAEKSGAQDEHQLRLESDENLVQIVTIHKSKGLQYPIVYCPFLWNEPEMRGGNQWFAWYDKAAKTSCLQAGQERMEEARQSRKADEMSENLRLLYVALTRAQYHCTAVLASGEVPRFNYRSALGWLLFGHLPDAEKILAGKSQMKPPQRQQLMQQQLQQLVQESGGNIGCDSLPAADTVTIYEPQARQTTLQSRRFEHSVPPLQRIGSFSGLTSGRHDERPDHDNSQITLSVPRRELREQNTFPGGARAGVCLHKMLERLDFTQLLSEQREDVVLRTLTEQGFDSHWADAAEQLLYNTVKTPLFRHSVFCLRDVGQSSRLDELEFYFPVHRLNVGTLQQILLIALPDDWLAIRSAVQRLAFSDLQGFMKGFVDLIFRHQGKYYVVDYKSNWLGEELADYAPDQLEQTMAEAHYYLQYLIYCLALHRYLRQRLGDDYDWDQQVGGVLYLFLRGMSEDAEPGNGVFFHRPEYELIAALDQLMG
ncbi:MAG: exodeoxyribonuclease V subunit beta [Thiolinea sp.]